jgi:hypothetical protein
LVPPEPKKVPIYLLQGLALLVGVVGVGIISTKLIRKLRSNGNGSH